MPITTAPADSPAAPRDPAAVRELHRDPETGLVMGRPVEDRSFEIVETAAAMVAGMAAGTVVAGPVGTAVGGVLGAAAGLAAAEALERAAGRAATTWDATATEEPSGPTEAEGPGTAHQLTAAGQR
jgi:hypothetical protein